MLVKIILSILCFIKYTLADGFLISDEFQLDNPSAITGWPQQTIQCTSLDISNRKNQKMFGIIDKTNNQNIQKTYTITQPHWSISVRVNIYMLKSFAVSDSISVYMNGVMQQSFQKGTNNNIGVALCLSKNDYLYQFYKNITHSANTFVLQFQSSISTTASTGGYALSELYIEVDTCYPGCQTCSGPAQNQCLTCITGAVANGGQCQCTTGFAYQASCVSSCPTGLRGDTTLLICVQDYCDTSICQVCDNTNKVCTQCKSGYYLLYNACVQSCPNYSSTQGNVCQDSLPASKIKLIFVLQQFYQKQILDGAYLLKALYQNFVSESEITGSGLTVTGLEGNGYGTLTSSGAYTSVCKGVFYIGGYMLAASNASFKKTFTGLPPHSQIRVGFTFVAIDDWDSEYIYIYYDGSQASSFMVNINDTVDDLCGLSGFLDLVYQVDKTAIHTSPTLNLEIHAIISKDSSQKSYGLRNLYVIVIQCSQWCISCNPTACLQCDITHYLYKGLCYVTCPTTTYIDLNRECHDCDTSCATCGGPNKTDCITCPPGILLYNNAGWTCVNQCPPTNYYSDGTTCKKCDTSCLTCSAGANNNCLTCNIGIYFYQNQCLVNCPSSTFVNGVNCANCDNSCLTCSGSSNSQCLSCASPNYLLTSGPKKCTSCSASLFLHIDGSCVTQCPNGFYGTNGSCKACPTQCITCIVQGATPICASCPPTQALYNGNCVASCPAKTFQSNNGTTNVCNSCDNSCQTCSGPNANQCLSCLLPNYFQPNTFQCVTTCSVKFYPVQNTATCAPCDPTCYQCSASTANDCTSCSGNLYLQNNTCKATCQNGTFPNSTTNQCQQCDSSCLTCSAATNVDCLSCSSPNFLQTDRNSCLPTCKASEYKDLTTNKCFQCNPACLACSGPGSDQCLGCLPGQFLFTQPNNKNNCVLSCPDGYFNDATKNACSQCSLTCLTCTAPGDSNSCLTCSKTTYLLNGQCVSSCPQKYYSSTSTNPSTQICNKCYQDCLTCSGPQNTDCKTCQLPLYFVAAISQCLASCPPKFYQNNPLAQCSSCDPSCATCSGPSSSQCLSCSGTLYLDGNSCISSCTPGKNINTQNNTCAQCDPSYPNQCLTCNGTDVLINGNTCQSNCPSGQYQNQTVCKPCDPSCKTCVYPVQDSTKVCIDCDQSCQICNGSLSNNCLSCASPLFLNTDNTCKAIYSNTQKCVTTCPSKYFANTSNNTCSACHPTCNSCNGSLSNNCISCSLPNYLQTNAQQCLPTCQLNEYQDSIQIACKACDPSCKTCNGQGPNKCQSCNANQYLYQGNSCVSNCPSGFYNNLTICSSCSSSCLTCNYPGDSSTCTSCSSNQFLYNGQCLQSCPPNTYAKICNQIQKHLSMLLFLFYKAQTGNTCILCNKTCSTCIGSNPNQCITCAASLYYNPNNQLCQSTCDDQFYPNNSNQACTPCDSSCYNCSGSAPNQCIQCAGNKNLDNSKCVTNCSPGKYKSPTSNVCLNCSSNCNTCSPTNPSSCLSCTLPYYFQYRDSTCQLTCQPDQYRDNNSVSCINCNTSCTTCLGSQNTDCLSCTGTFLQNTQCVSSCQDGYYPNKITQRCENCNRNCKQCFGPDQNSCLSCVAPLIYQKSTSQCVSVCNQNQYINLSTNTCESCYVDCASCRGSLNNQCTSCSGQKYLYQNTCVASCPNGNYANQNICQQCTYGCQVCYDGSANKCIVCMSGYFLQKGQCVKSCPEFYFADIYSFTCQPCSSNCSQCENYGSLTCLKCGNGYNLYENACIQNCPVGTYVNNQICNNCDASCLSCIGPSDNQCTSCQSQIFLQDNYCVSQCDSNYATILSQQLCVKCDPSCLTCSGGKQDQCLTCTQNSIPFNTQCLQQCPSGYYQTTGQLKCNECKPNCSKCTNSTDCLSCSQGFVMLNGACLSQCPSQMYFVQSETNQCTLCNDQCKDTGCFGPGEDDCIYSYVDVKESILFIIFMIKLGYWIFNSISGYFMDKFDEKEHIQKVSKLLRGDGSIMKAQIISQIQDQAQEGSAIKRKNRNKFDDIGNQSATDQKNLHILNNQTIQNISLNTSVFQQQQNNSKIFNTSQFDNKQIKMNPVKNQSWRDLPNEFINMQNQSYRNVEDSPIKNNMNSFTINQNYVNNNLQFPTRRPIILKRFSFKQDDGCATFREQEDQFQATTNKIEEIIQPIYLPCNQKLYYSLIGNDLIQVWTLYNPLVSRIFRATLVYFKFLCFFYEKPKFIGDFPFFRYDSQGGSIYSFNSIYNMFEKKCCSGCIVVSQFSYNSGFNMVQARNLEINFLKRYFMVLDTFIALVRYISSVRHLEKRNDKTQALLDRTLVDQGVLYKLSKEI
ncbi:hypothetical protein ABPG72_017052 [Tetrahymena utriculariae]